MKITDALKKREDFSGAIITGICGAWDGATISVTLSTDAALVMLAQELCGFGGEDFAKELQELIDTWAADNKRKRNVCPSCGRKKPQAECAP